MANDDRKAPKSPDDDTRQQGEEEKRETGIEYGANAGPPVLAGTAIEPFKSSGSKPAGGHTHGKSEKSICFLSCLRPPPGFHAEGRG